MTTLNPTTKYLFDTTVFIDYLRKRPIGLKLYQQALSLKTGYSILTEAELWGGILNTRTPAEHENLLLPFEPFFVTSVIARRAGRLQAAIASKKGQTIPGIVDCIIAATAEMEGAVVVSRNSQHFSLFVPHGIEVIEYSL